MEIVKHESFPRKIGRYVAQNIAPHGVAYPIARGPIRGEKFILGAAAGEGGGASTYLNLYEVEHTQLFVDTLQKGDVVFDIGANVGYYTLLSSKVVEESGSVFAFEPNVRNLSYLYRHTKLNALDNVTIIPSAVSNKLDFQFFASGINNATGHLLEGDGVGTELIATLTIDDFVKRVGQSPNVMKIDVEGAEIQVLQGAKHVLETAHPKLFLSTHSIELEASCRAILEPMGYELWEMKEGDEAGSEFLCVVPENGTVN